MTLYCVDIVSTGVDFKNDRIMQLVLLKVQDEWIPDIKIVDNKTLSNKLSV